jgi:2-dehydro-3-deoxygluconokinase
MAFDGQHILREPGLPSVQPIDRLGAGDAFTAGLLYGVIHQNLRQGLKFGLAMSAMKMGTRGDIFRASLSDVYDVLKSRGGGVKR